MIVALRGRRYDVGTPSGEHYRCAGAFLAVPCDAVKTRAHVNLSDDKLARLARGIREGEPLPPICVQASDDERYQLIDGDHRLALSRAAGYSHIPVVYDGMP